MTGAGIARRWWVVALLVTWGSLLALQATSRTSTLATMTIGACIGLVLVVLDSWIARRRRLRDRALGTPLSSGSRPGSA